MDKTPPLLAVRAHERTRLEALAEEAWELRDEDPARAQTLIGAQLEQASHDPHGRAAGLIVAAFLAFREERCDVALGTIFEAQALCADGAMPLWTARLYNTLGGCYLMLGERELGLEAYQKQLASAQESGVLYEIFSAYHDLGVYFSLAKDHDHALEFFRKAGQHLPPDARSRAFLERNLAEYYADQGMFDEAKRHAEAAFELSRGMGRVIEVALEGLAYVATQQGDYDEALRVGRELLERQSREGLVNAETLLNIARSLLALGESREAFVYLDQALGHVEAGGSKLFSATCHQMLSEAYKRQGAFEQALAHHERFHAVYEEVFRESSEVKVRGLEVVHRITSLKQESESLRKNNESLKLHNEELQRLHERVFELSIRDVLTGLYNRRYLLEQVEAVVRLAHRYDQALSVVMLDIDHFKQVNDTYGHKTGDAVLTRLGELLRTTLRETDVAARYGGEEFAVLMPNTTLEDAAVTCERLRQRISEDDWSALPPALRVTVSIGLAASSPTEPQNEEALFTQADEQLYRSKRSGRNRVSFTGSAEPSERTLEAQPEVAGKARRAG